MSNLGDIEKEVWEHIQAATKSHNASRLAYFGVLADEIETRKKDWIDRLAAGLRTNGGRHPEADPPGLTRPNSTRSDGDYTGRPIRGFEFDGIEMPVSTYKDLLVLLTNLLRKKYGEGFDSRALALGGRKRRYFSPDPRQLKYAHELEPGGLFVETNLNANLVVKICYEIVRALGLDEDKLKIR